MPNCDFYALAPDLVKVLDFVFTQPGWRLVELTSLNDHSLRSFHSTHEVLEAFPTYSELSIPLHFQLYSEAMGAAVTSSRITYNSGAVPGATFRHDSQGWGLIQVYFGQLRAGCLTNCHTNHNSERRARNWESTYPLMAPVDAWNWKEVTRTSSLLNRFIRRSAPGKLHRRPALPAAWEAHAKGEVQLDYP